MNFEFERMSKKEQAVEIAREVQRVVDFAAKHGFVVTVEHRHPNPLSKPSHSIEVRPARGNY